MGTGTRPSYRAVTGIAPPYVMYNSTAGTFYGYCIDLLNDIGSLAGFDYTVRESFDEHYGHRDRISGRWNGMVYELMNNTSDIAVGPMWITSDRGQVIDFSVPYQKPSGFAVMMLKRKRQVPFLRFLMILELEVWLGFALAFLLTVFLLFILERCSPFSYRNNREKYRGRPDDRFCSLKECFWFAFTSVTPQGGKDIPKNLSGKVAAATWWLFGFVIVAAYTANLAAYETLERLERSVESVDDLRRQYRIEYSTLANSSAFRYFEGMKKAEDTLYNSGTLRVYIRRQRDEIRSSSVWRRMTLDEKTPEWNRSKYAVWDYPLEDRFTKMYYAMEGAGFVPSVEQAVDMVRKVNRTYQFAFIAEAMTIKYLMLTSCDFRLVGEEFSRKPFAFAVQKGSPLKRKIDDAITQLAVQRRLNELEKKWWDENPLRVNCPSDKDVNAGFDLDNLAVVFLLILVGISLAILILCAEYIWHRYQLKRKNKNARVFVRAVLTHPKFNTGPDEAPRIEENSQK